ncbi:MAG: hypothetical protein K9M99_08350 [Candidatus Cloacimonetes bacterium]|nr:hypothetical protein [Candidatus Cloacimonadota bacterium]
MMRIDFKYILPVILLIAYIILCAASNDILSDNEFTYWYNRVMNEYIQSTNTSQGYYYGYCIITNKNECCKLIEIELGLDNPGHRFSEDEILLKAAKEEAINNLLLNIKRELFYSNFRSKTVTGDVIDESFEDHQISRIKLSYQKSDIKKIFSEKLRFNDMQYCFYSVKIQKGDVSKNGM